MVTIFVVAIVEDAGCVIVFIAGQDLVSIEFASYDKVVSGGIVKFVSGVIRREMIGIAVVAPTVVVVRGVIGVVFIRQAIVGIMVVVGLAIGGIRGIAW